MLVLTRRKGQKIIIGDSEVVITLLKAENGEARIGIDADESITVHREEVYSRIQKEKAAEVQHEK